MGASRLYYYDIFYLPVFEFLTKGAIMVPLLLAHKMAQQYHVTLAVWLVRLHQVCLLLQQSDASDLSLSPENVLFDDLWTDI